jgi:hypothetical protein
MVGCVKFEVLRVVNMGYSLWDMNPCILLIDMKVFEELTISIFCPEDGGSRFFQKPRYPTNGHMAPHLKRHNILNASMIFKL